MDSVSVACFSLSPHLAAMSLDDACDGGESVRIVGADGGAVYLDRP